MGVTNLGNVIGKEGIEETGGYISDIERTRDIDCLRFTNQSLICKLQQIQIN